jgi:Na+/phosphate symporter
MGTCSCWGAQILRRHQIRDQKRKIGQKLYLQELENDRLHDEEKTAERKILTLVNDPEHAAEVYSLARNIITSQDKQVRAAAKLEFLHAIEDRVDVAQQTDEMRATITDAASVVFRVRDLPPPPNFARAATIVQKSPARARTLSVPLLTQKYAKTRSEEVVSRIIITKKLKSIEEEKDEEDNALKKRLERLKKDGPQ